MPVAPAPTARVLTPSDELALRLRLQQRLDAIRASGRIPGMTAAVALPNGDIVAVASGMADTARGIPMRPDDRMLAGSVGKTYVAALALQLVHDGRLNLDDHIAKYLADKPWFARLPNAQQITVRELMNHTSGLVRYEFQPRFTSALTAAPDREWSPEQELAFVLDSKAPFRAGSSWEYSDTNYIVLGIILERITGMPYVDAVQRRVLDPLALHNTVPSNSERIAGLAQGYAGPHNAFGGSDAMLRADGRMTINPQFEGAGGGMATTAGDLARWAKLLYEGHAFDPSLMPQVLDGVPSSLGPATRYGLGVIIRDTPMGPSWGHSGFFPGYLTDMAYFPRCRCAVAMQVNTSAPHALPEPSSQLLTSLATLVSQSVAAAAPRTSAMSASGTGR